MHMALKRPVSGWIASTRTTSESRMLEVARSSELLDLRLGAAVDYTPTLASFGAYWYRVPSVDLVGSGVTLWPCLPYHRAILEL